MCNGVVRYSDLLDAANTLSTRLQPLDDLVSTTDTPTMQGRMLVLEVRPYLYAMGHIGRYVQDTALVNEVEDIITCSVLLAGDAQPMQIEPYPPFRFVLNQTQLLCVSGKATCRAVCKAGSENTWVGFHIKKSWFETTDCDASLRSLEKLFDSGHVQRVLGPLTGLVQLGAQLQTPRYSGALQKLYTESCALSAVAELAHCLSNDSEKPVTINSRQLKRVKDAQAIIDQRLADPPSVDELCNSVAVNATSLRAHFREVLGTSIFGYLRTRRLEVAKILLEESELSIGEVGNRVGFSNAGAFSVAYRKRFGHRPSQVRSRKPD